MMVSAAFFAPTSPPDTGASTYSQPSSLMRFANFLVSIGEIELMSTTILPLVRPSATPFGAEQHFLDVRRVGHHRDDDVGFLRDFLRAGAGLAARRGQLLRHAAAAS